MRKFARFTLAALAAAMFLGAAQDAKAVYSPTLVNVVDNGDGTYTWNYNVNWSTLTPATSELTTGDFFTLYDVNGYVAGSATTTGGSDHAFLSAQNIGINAPAQAPPDNPNVVNLTFQYTGSGTSEASKTFSGISFKSIVPGTVTQTLGWYSSQYLNLTTTPSSDIGESGRVNLPGVVPEPSSIALVGMGLAGLFGYGYRRRRQG